MTLFGFGRSARVPPDDEGRRRIEGWVREAASLNEADVVKVNEILCPDPACPGYETVIPADARGTADMRGQDRQAPR